MTPQTPVEAIELFSACLNEGDVDGAIELYEPDAVFVPEPGRSIRGLDEIRAALAEFAALKPELSGSVKEVLEAGDTALVKYDWRLVGTAPDGAPVEMAARSADVVRRQADGSWRVLIDDPYGTS